jgi:prolyl-tRNA editing enzyme YbaK/EbsC (Cys-tRNA(Pro) deacylase)
MVFAMVSHELASRRSATESRPPGEVMSPAWLGYPVISCKGAATARGVPLKNEIKTLILDTSVGLVAAHLRGDSMISLRAVKVVLAAQQARLASPESLLSIGLIPGTVSAILEPVWSLPHLIDQALLTLGFVTTNNRTTTGYFRFDPKILLTASLHTLANFSISGQ